MANNPEVTASIIQAVAAALTFVATAVLVGVTWWYARTTRTMANATVRTSAVMTQDYETRVSPLVELRFEKAYHVTLDGRGQFNIKLRPANIGTLPVTIESLTLHWWHDTDPAKSSHKDFDEHRGEAIKGTDEASITAILFEDEARLSDKNLKLGVLKQRLRMRAAIEVSNGLGRRASKQTQEFRIP